MSLREEIAAATAYCDRMTAKANDAERDGNDGLAEHFDNLCEAEAKRIAKLRAELAEEESRGGFDRIARRLNLSEF